MSFHSLDYLLFLPLAVAAFFLTPHRWRWIILLVASIIFYASWRVEFLSLLLFSTVLDYSVGLALPRATGVWKRRALMGLSLVGNLGLLMMFKFFTQTANGWFDAAFDPGTSAATPMLFLLPLGISFYTFQTLSYTIDIFNRKREPERHFGHFAVYVMYFPQLIAGPIERAGSLMPQLLREQHWSLARAASGCALILVGLFKKLVIADGLGQWLAIAATGGQDQPPLGLVAIAVGTAYRYYADLSGYADIAIGSSLILGIKLSQNFRRPLSQSSVTHFWQNWHITVSNWFRDYLFIPLARRTSRFPLGRSFAVIAAMLAVGVWHGATINWLTIGLVGGIIICVSNATHKLLAQKRAGTPALRTVAVVEFVVLWLYIPFIGALVYVRDFAPAMAMVRDMTRLPQQLAAGNFGLGIAVPAYLLLVIVALEIYQWFDAREPVFKRLERRGRWAAYVFYLALIAAIIVLGTYDNPDFLYFQF